MESSANSTRSGRKRNAIRTQRGSCCQGRASTDDSQWRRRTPPLSAGGTRVELLAGAPQGGPPRDAGDRRRPVPLPNLWRDVEFDRLRRLKARNCGTDPKRSKVPVPLLHIPPVVTSLVHLHPAMDGVAKGRGHHDHRVITVLPPDHVERCRGAHPRIRGDRGIAAGPEQRKKRRRQQPLRVPRSRLVPATARCQLCCAGLHVSPAQDGGLKCESFHNRRDLDTFISADAVEPAPPQTKLWRQLDARGRRQLGDLGVRA
ncbi:MAG: hypothetical protein QOJ89_3047 [bacterium]